MLFKRELKINFKSFIIWTIILIAIFSLVYLIYPSIMSSDNIAMINDMLSIFPKEVLIAFNMDISSIDNAYGWFKTEGFIFILLFSGIYASILGSSIVLKEKDSKTIEYLNSLPISRNYIMTSKIIVSLFYIICMILIIGIFNYICLISINTIDIKQYWLLSITPLFSSLPLFAINLFISLHLNKARTSFGIALFMSMISYIMNMIANLSEEIKIIKYFTVYTLADIRNVIINNYININLVVISFIITIIFILFSYRKYHTSELV